MARYPHNYNYARSLSPASAPTTPAIDAAALLNSTITYLMMVSR